MSCGFGLHYITSYTGSMPGVGARGQNLVCLENVVFLCFYIRIGSPQKAFTLGPYAYWRLYFYFVTSDTRVHARGWGLSQSLELFKLLYFKFLRSVDTSTEGNLENPRTSGAKDQNLVQL